jgi:hypothetical protein
MDTLFKAFVNGYLRIFDAAFPTVMVMIPLAIRRRRIG